MPSDEEVGQPQGVLAAAWSNRFLVLAIVLAFGIGALLYSISRPPKFVAVSTVILDDQAGAQAFGQATDNSSARLVRNQLQIFRSTSVALAAVSLAAERGVEIDVAEVVASSTFTNLNDTAVITVTFSHEDQATAEVLVEALVDGYRQVRLEQSLAENQAVLERLESAEALLNSELAQLEEEISHLRAVRGLPSQISLLLDQIAATARQLSDPSADRETLIPLLSSMSTQLGSLELAQDVESENSAISSLVAQQQTVLNQLAAIASQRTEEEIGAETVGAGILFVSLPASSAPGGGAGRLFTLLAGSALGFLVGVGIAYALASRRGLLDDRIQPQSILGAPLLADVPIFSGASALPVRDSPRSPEAESFRFAAANLALLQERSESTTILVVSGNVGEGKSTIVANTAIASARSGRRVLVVDADFGHQAVSTLLLGNFRKGPGLTEVVAGSSTLSEAVITVRVSEHTTVDVLTRGIGQAVAPDIFSNPNVEQIIKRATQIYDLVLIDGPPLLQVAYATLLARLADATVVVILAGSPFRSVQEVSGRLSFIGKRVLGYVYNQAPLRPEMVESGGSMKDILGDQGIVEPVASRSRG